jgi:serine/threonine-protein kinase
MDTAQPISERRAWLSRVESIFYEALEQPANDRPAFLADRCEGDGALLHDVQAMLDADGSEDGFLAGPALGSSFAMPSLGSLGESSSSQRIGPYQLLRPLGSGGIANVWLARRVDGQFDKQVAIKLIKRGMDTDAIVQRFMLERQLLARLEHPLIARLLDGGMTDAGLPYLIMEYVDGVPIDLYCREKRVGVTERITLFCRICEAVQYAHQSLVIHRDIKPGNILVNSEGDPKLLDFGIAKVLAGEGSSGETTANEARLLTPQYASPEQLEGRPVTTASDVFSLGVVLYEMLTSLRPFETDRRDSPSVSIEPVRPSTRLTHANRNPAESRLIVDSLAQEPARLAHRLRGDLDTIVLKALAYDPVQRYSTAQQLSEDLRRHLEHVPITARPPTHYYRAKRFVQRNLGGVIAASIATAAIICGFVISTVAYFQADRARRSEAQHRQLADLRLVQTEAARAETSAEAAKVRATNAFLQDLLATSDPTQKLRPDIELREVLDEAARSLDRGTLASQPEVEAAIRVTVGRTYKGLRMCDRAESHVRKALEIQKGLPAGEDLTFSDTMYLLAVCLCEQQKFREGVPLHRRSLELQRKLAPGDEKTIMTRLWGLSTALRDDEKLAEAESWLREALAICLRVNGPHHKDTAHTRYLLGWALYLQNRNEEAESELRTALALQRELLGDKHSACGDSLLRLGLTLERENRISEAESLVRDAVAHEKNAFGDVHPLTLRAKSNLARFLSRHDKGEEAEAIQREVFAQSEAYYGPSYPSVGDALQHLSQIQSRRGDLAGAEKSILEAMKRHRAELGNDDPRLQGQRIALADILEKGQRYSDAESVLLEACSISDKLTDTDAAVRRKPVERLIQLYESWCKSDPTTDRCASISQWQQKLAAVR